MKAKVSFKDGEIVTVQKAKNEKERTLSTKSVSDMNSCDEFIETMTINGVEDLESIQKFSRVPSKNESGFEEQRIKVDENLSLRRLKAKFRDHGTVQDRRKKAAPD